MEYGFDVLVHHTLTLLFFLLQTVFVPEEANFGSTQEMGHMSELQNKHLCTRSEEHQFTSDMHKNLSIYHKPQSCICAIILGSSHLHVMYVRNLSNGQVN